MLALFVGLLGTGLVVVGTGLAVIPLPPELQDRAKEALPWATNPVLTSIVILNGTGILLLLAAFQLAAFGFHPCP